MSLENETDSVIIKPNMQEDGTILNGDSLNVLKTLPSDSVDAVITDPPYGYSFMGKDWDKAVPSVDIWRECLRVLKPGGWCMVMSAPRSDVQNAMISRLMEAGFRLDFTPIYWTYASGFPKAGNVGKLVDKRLGAERGRIAPPQVINGWRESEGRADRQDTIPDNIPITDQAKALDGSYIGFQPKPAVEVIIVAMKPLSEKTYVDQALKNGKGITWLDDCRVPTRDNLNGGAYSQGDSEWKWEGGKHQRKPGQFEQPTGRFPANLLVSDEALAEHSRFFDLGKWYERSTQNGQRTTESLDNPDRGNEIDGRRETHESARTIAGRDDPALATLPFLIVPKASKSEKNKGVDKNHHPTVKPLKLMSYLITLTTRPGDTVLDPFVGSGTTVVAAKQLNRIGIGIEREQEYAVIAAARVFDAQKEPEPPQQLSLVEDAS